MPCEPKLTKITSSSTTGVGVAGLLRWGESKVYSGSIFRAIMLKTLMLRVSSPEFRSKQRSLSSSDASSPVVSQISSFQITGEDQPESGTAVFHFMFLASSKWIGILPSFEIPFPCGPRNWFQFSAPLQDARDKVRAPGVRLHVPRARRIAGNSW